MAPLALMSQAGVKTQCSETISWTKVLLITTNMAGSELETASQSAKAAKASRLFPPAAAPQHPGTAADFMAADPRLSALGRTNNLGGSGTLLGSSQQSAIQIDTESDGSTSARQRRRGRPPKRHSAHDKDSPLRLAVMEDHPMPDISPGDRELRPKAMEPSFSQPAPSPQFPPMSTMAQPREGVSTRRQEKMLAEAAASRPPILAPAPQTQQQQQRGFSMARQIVGQGTTPVQISPQLQFATHPQAVPHSQALQRPMPVSLPSAQQDRTHTPINDDGTGSARAQGRSFREVIM